MSAKYVRFGDSVLQEDAQERYAEWMRYRYCEKRDMSDEQLDAEWVGGFITYEQYQAIKQQKEVA